MVTAYRRREARCQYAKYREPRKDCACPVHMDGFVFTTPSGEKIVMRGSLESRNWARGQIKPSAPGTGDAALLDLAEVDGRVLLTLDRDFWQIAIERRKPPERSGVIFRRAGTCDTMYLREVSHVDHDGSRARG